METTRCEEVVLPLSIAPNLEKSLKAMKEIEYKDGDVLICTYPKCGSHYTESLIRCMLRKDVNENILSRSCLLELSAPDYVNTLESPRVFFTHLYPNRIPTEHVKKRGKMVLVLRNPKDVIVSMFYHYRRSVVLKNMQSWDEFFETCITGNVIFGDVFTYLKKWQDALKTNEFDMEYFYFEDLKLNANESLKRLAKHIGVTKSGEELKAIFEECSIDKIKSKVNPDTIPKALQDDKNEMVIYRKGEIGDWKNHFTVAQNERFDRRLAEQMKDILFSFRYE